MRARAALGDISGSGGSLPGTDDRLGDAGKSGAARGTAGRRLPADHPAVSGRGGGHNLREIRGGASLLFAVAGAPPVRQQGALHEGAQRRDHAASEPFGVLAGDGRPENAGYPFSGAGGRGL